MLPNKILSLDLGVTSCGFSVLEQFEDNKYRLIDYGVFMRDNPKPDNQKSPKALRSDYKSKRKLIDNKQKRVKDIRDLLYSKNIYQGDTNAHNIDIWQLRGKDAFERRLEDFEYFSILRFLAKHRGYKSLKIDDLIKEIHSKNALKTDCDKNNQIEEPEDLEDFAKTLAYLDALKCQNQDKTVTQIIYDLQKNEKVKKFRNHNNYRFMIRREDIKKEISTITHKQNEFGFFADDIDIEKLIKDITDIIITQDPVTLNTDLINNCSLIKNEKCAPLYSFRYDYFKMIKTVNDLKIDGKSISEEQKESIVDYVMTRVYTHEKVEHITVKEIKKLLYFYEPNTKINNLPEYKTIKGKKEPTKLLSFHWFAKLHKFDKKILDTINTHQKSQEIYDALAFSIQTKIDPADFLGTIYNIFETYEISQKFDEEKIKNFALTLFENKKSGTGKYSFLALQKLLEIMQDGVNESDAIAQAGLGINQESYENFHKGIKYLNLNQYEKDKNELSNHVVKSLVSGALRLIKDLHKKYGSFDTIKIESARELRIPEDAKKEIKSANDKNEKIWDILRKEYASFAGERGLSNTQILKIKLWKQQDQKGIYSNKSMGISDVLGEKSEIEHIVPQTCGGSSAEYNLALDFKDENAKKGNKLPLDYLTGEQKEIYKKTVQKLRDQGAINYKKWKNLLAEDLSQTFKETRDDANMHATSYAEKLLGEVVKMYYPFQSEEKQKNGTGVMHISGRATSHLRKILGIESKSRETNFHHAEDAIILALMSRGYLQKISKTFRENYGKETISAKSNLKNIFPTIEGAYPAEIIAKIREYYDTDIEISPFFKNHENRLKTIYFWVSKKPIGTQAHNETIQSAKNYAYRVPLSTLINEIKPKPSYKTKPEKFLEEFNKKVYDRLQIAKDNPADYTAKAIKKRGDDIAGLLNKYQFVTTKEEQENANKAIRECLNAPVLDVNGNEIRRVKRIGQEATIKVRNGVAYTAPSLVYLKISKKRDSKSLLLKRLDIRSSQYEPNSLPANEMKVYINDLVEVFTITKNITTAKYIGIVRGFTESGNRVTLRNPKFPLLVEKQPKSYKEKKSIGNICGIIKYKVDISGNILGTYRLGTVLINNQTKVSNNVIYGPLE